MTVDRSQDRSHATSTWPARPSALFETMNREWWAGPVEAYHLQRVCRRAARRDATGRLALDDLMTDDELVLARLEASENSLIAAQAGEHPAAPAGVRPELFPESRSQGPLARPAGRDQRHAHAALRDRQHDQTIIAVKPRR